MQPQTDPEFLLSQEYNEASALNTRIEIQARYSLKRYGWFHWLFDQLRDIPEEGRILELGCGPGHLWLDNSSRLPGGWQVALSDFSQGMVDEARQQLADQPAFSFHLLDAQAIAFPDNHFDAVIANGIYDHVPHRKQAFAETARVLKPGGRLYASAGGRTHLQQLEELVRPFAPDADYGGAPERFGLENGQALLAAWFLDVQQSDYEDTLVFRDAYPIVAYLLSEAAARPTLSGPRLRDLLRHLQAKLAAEGEIHVAIQKGLFTARKAPAALPEQASSSPKGQDSSFPALPRGSDQTNSSTFATRPALAAYRPWCIANCARYHHRTSSGRRHLPRKQNGPCIKSPVNPSLIREQPYSGGATLSNNRLGLDSLSSSSIHLVPPLLDGDIS
jgi:SAM-dependent methyltransferase